MSGVRDRQDLIIFRSKVFKILINDKGYDISSLFCAECHTSKELIDDVISAAFLIKDLLKDSSVKRYRRFLYKQKLDNNK